MRRWDIFCEVVDNLGDIGVCWRLAQQLADEHEAVVRLWVDKLETFACLCPSILTDAVAQQVGPIEIRHWQSDFPAVDVADVVVEAFACELPATYVSAMALRPVAPVWVNLEYLSAESWVEDCHLLPSPHPRLPLTKYFYFPGFTAKTGGLLRERNLLASCAAFDPAAATKFWSRLDVAPRTDDELRISLFCYDNPALPELLQCWADGPAPVRVLASPGAATEQVACWFADALSPGRQLRRGSLTVQALPFLPQSDYDRLLWACDVNFVRGEDSFVRAQWAEQPFVWQIYPQAENAHFVKLDAFLTRYLGELPEAGGNSSRTAAPSKPEARAKEDFACASGFDGRMRHSPNVVADVVRYCWHAWNGSGDMATAWPDYIANRQSLQRHGKVWANQLDRLGDLANNLARFVHGK